MHLRFDDLDATARGFSRDSVLITARAHQMLPHQGQELAKVMRENINVLTGASRASITSDPSATEDASGVWVEAGAEHFVPRFLENGTSKMAPRPWAEPAFAERIPAFFAAAEALARL